MTAAQTAVEVEAASKEVQEEEWTLLLALDRTAQRAQFARVRAPRKAERQGGKGSRKPSRASSCIDLSALAEDSGDALATEQQEAHPYQGHYVLILGIDDHAAVSSSAILRRMTSEPLSTRMRWRPYVTPRNGRRPTAHIHVP